ncbi:oligopeptide transporter, OPT family [Campylobacter sp. MIT 99-7217]|uniref:OPT family oligopeptide transporter n=1 Tax=Campylobacter sp. MIT 99-7217 TaxID=535091 RepID=UPI00115AAE67|nr:oligopeptide transporter, OPT family [Campylobacter sp. MIT 99-7217]TQR31349.1 oligopeptide transporter, OPT family [Campylobacter sp. MIT 99-7217]
MNKQIKELTFRGMFLGAILTLIFTASNVYLGLKVGLTFSSSIPAVVIAVAVFSLFKSSNILENNMVQTQVSAAGTLSAVIFVLPGLFIVGYWNDFNLWQTFMLCFCGGVLGVLFTIPLRKAMVVESKLAYPEGIAAAEILKAVDKEKDMEKGSRAGLKEISLGALIAGLVSLCSNGFKLLVGESAVAFMASKMAFCFSMGYSLALLGAGYLIGLLASVALFIGIFLAWGILVPYFSAQSVFTDGSLSDFAFGIWKDKVRLIGTGIIATAALWTLFELSKSVFEGLKATFKRVNLSEEQTNDLKNKDLSFKTIVIFFVLMVLGLFVSFYSFVNEMELSFGLCLLFSSVGVLIAVLIGFFVAATCGYMAGLVGSSSSPISGIGIIGVIVSSFVVLLLIVSANLSNDPLMIKFAIALAIFITSAILATAAISNDNLQDLKTGYLVGASPFRQQIALIVGCFFGALAIAPVLELLYQAYGFVGSLPREGMDASAALAAPQANLMATLSQGIFNDDIDYTLIGFGVLLGIIIILLDKILRKLSKLALPPLAVGIGVYLPPAVSIPIVIGGLVAFLLRKKLQTQFKDKESIERKENKGILFASGLIVGESLVGVVIAIITVFSISNGGSENPLALSFLDAQFLNSELLSLVIFLGVVFYFIKRVLKRDKI